MTSFIVRDESMEARNKMVKSLRELADGIERGDVKYKSGGLILGTDEEGMFLSGDLRVSYVKVRPSSDI